MNATTPVRIASELVEGDLCDIVTSRRYCQQEGAAMAADADGRVRILCAHHAALYLPMAVAA